MNEDEEGREAERHQDQVAARGITYSQAAARSMRSVPLLREEFTPLLP
jgi:hypothetical protein